MPPASLPNILWIFSDQHRGSAMSCAGDPNIETPHLDRLAAGGTRFTNAYTTCPLCAPFRATLYTGQYVHTHGVTSLFRPLLPHQPELAEVLHEHGYHTSHMGKWHLSGGDCPCHYVSPYFRPGWDDWLGWENSNDFFKTTYSVGDHPHPVRTLDGYQTDAITDLTIEWLRHRPKGEPWFHVMSFEPPHSINTQLSPGDPYVAPPTYMKAFADKPLTLPPNFAADHPRADFFEQCTRGYYAEISNMDDNIGRILAALEEAGQLDSTLIFYFSDHGDMMGSHGAMQKCRPEEESANIPLIVHWPGMVPAGRVADGLIGAVDFMPTLLGLLGVPVPDTVQGSDLSGLLTGATDIGDDATIIQQDGIFYPPRPESCFRAIRSGQWLYTVYLTRGPSQLFDLGRDPFELENLIDAPEHVDTRGRLHTQLKERLEEIGDDFLDRCE
ncbi:MAG: sulfatase [Lentisphaerae bacterium]|nr:sulfatase [Lentisphaerota bacterium]MBT4815768.1 sulfatase [Lentisphaerota bacterium]MBT5604815.1 sulfatase [Lentisphaerota bacterium]MBT7053566.1 sulfatase [Lentisphaerota bacterium]MBT7843403.1 sulfatase [Lentisphaerota bacterium]